MYGHVSASSLRYLTTDNVGWTKIPAGALTSMVELLELDMRNNHLSLLPDLTSNTALTNLVATKNRITLLPDLTKNTRLTDMHVENNRITLVPDLTKNTALARLYVRNNRITRPFDLTKNTALEKLDLSDNPLSEVPSLKTNTALFWVRMILNNLESNLTQLPDLATNTALETLYFSGNSLSSSSWPQSLERLTMLKHITLNSNQLTTIPAFVYRLPHLIYLDVSDNAITSLDELMVTGDSNAQSGRNNETFLLLGNNPVCVNGTSGGSLDAKWNVSCRSLCSSGCMSAGTPANKWGDSRGDGTCHFKCNTTACSYDGGDCFGYVSEFG